MKPRIRYCYSVDTVKEYQQRADFIEKYYDYANDKMVWVIVGRW